MARPYCSRLPACWLFAALLLGLPAGGWAASGARVLLPANGKPTASGLLLSIDPTWTDNEGYRPVRIAAQCVPPAAGDRSLSLLLTVTTWPSGRTACSSSTELEIPAGSSGASVTLAVPQFTPWQMLTVTTWEDGQKIEALSANLGGLANFNQATGLPALLVIDDPPAAHNFDAFYQAFQQGSISTNAPGLPMSSDLVGLPGDWINYTSFDFIAISLDALARLPVANPPAWQAIRDWTAAGGNLCVFGLSAELAQLAEIDRLLDDRPASESLEHWSVPDNAQFNSPLDLAAFAQGGSYFGVVGVPPAAQVTVNSSDPAAALAAPASPPFRLREMRLGRVAALAGDPFPAPGATGAAAHTWVWLLNSLTPARGSWVQRHGLSYQSNNPDFWSFLVPDVGLPPVDAYRVLITLFVILIGPVNYLVLRRLRRLHLLLFIVPTCAALATLALLGYAIVADGLGVRMRARSYTRLDQRRGEAVAWSRLSYYAGLSPSGGLTFPRDAAVFPLEYEAMQAGTTRGGRTTDWSDAQHLVRGWLPARTMTQLVVVRSGRDRRRLNIQPADGKLRVTNELQADVEQGLLADGDGQLYFLPGLAQRAVVELEPLPGISNGATGSRVPLSLTTALSRQRLDETVVPGGGRSMFGLRRRAYYFPGMGGGPNLQQGASLLEQALRHANEVVGNAGQLGAGLPARSYLAIVEQSDPQLIGVSSAREERSFHVIEGQW